MRIKRIKTKNLRRFVQLGFTAVSNSYLPGFLKGNVYKGGLKKACLPGLNCYSCPGALGSCPIGSLQAVLGDRKFNFSFYVTGFLILFGALLGRFICGWLCPFGFFQDLIAKIPFPKKLKKLPGDKILLALKYFILIFFVILMPLFYVDIIGQGQPWFCKYICPSGTLMAGIPLYLTNEGIQNAAGLLFYYKLSILIFITALSLIVYRPFCRYLCPLGVIYGLFNPISFKRYEIDKNQCTNCGNCQKSCKMDINISKTPKNRLCIRCGHCKNNCRTKAIKQT